MYEHNDSTDDEITSCSGAGGLAHGPPSHFGLFRQVLAPGLHAASALCHPCLEELPQDRLPGSGSVPRRFSRAPRGSGPGKAASLLDALQSRTAAFKKGESFFLLVQATVCAQQRGLIDDRPEAAVDATGLDSRYTSRYYFARSGKKQSKRFWTKLTVACHTGSHFFTGLTVSTGPSNDSPQFAPVLKQTGWFVRWDRVLGDAAFDSEANHRFCREDLGVRSTVIPINRRSQGRKWPRSKYRRQMKRRFHQRKYGQRWQAESAFSRHKRLLGSALTARSDQARERQCRLRVLTHNVMLLAAAA